ncbi:AraC family transcriptional regulator [Ralstonia flaminis]|nr:AraC family transcriptional regulator [Ralstonia sp. LMG 18101]
MTATSTATLADCCTAPPLRVRPAPSPLPLWRLRLATTYIEANLSEPIRLEDVARAAGLTRMHFAAQFRAAMGVRPHDYLLQRRIARAQVLLMRAETAVVEIALSVGFQSQAHFSTVFKRLAGDSPSIWRRRALDGMHG